ncbi:calcium-binding protein [Ancylobacter lacus]|uniref:calcium-binding protein n=1 Tax=Ancylobacter lacus TaxID=2579970 RepID=UPI001BCDACE9|nr:calcium-binding protein [Ancylobacter lacus]MBS7540580.1 hypothetical protein [Ancylobacter lacus]
MNFTRSGKFSRTSTTTNTTTNETLSTYGYYGSSVIYTASGGDTTLTGSAANEAFIYDLTLSGTNALRFSGFDTFDAGGGDDIMDFTVRPANAGHEYGTDATVYGGLGNDVIWTAGSHLANVYGDNGDIAGTSGSPVIGGNDRIDASAASATSFIYGDANKVSNYVGGNDTIVGSAYTDQLSGDVMVAGNGFVGGNDVIFAGGGGWDALDGDAIYIGDGSDTVTAVCGNDTLHGSSDSDSLVGDASAIQSAGQVQFGNDIIDGAGGDDYLFGDTADLGNKGTTVIGGNDTFVFQPNSGADTIFDFGQSAGSTYGDDLIDVSAYGYTSFASLNISGNGTDSVVVNFGGGNQVTVQNLTNTPLTLSASDFIFAS